MFCGKCGKEIKNVRGARNDSCVIESDTQQEYNGQVVLSTDLYERGCNEAGI